VATSPARTDRWKALDFSPPASDAEEPDLPVLVEYTHDGRVAVITLNRPHADNAITTEMGARLTEILETIAIRPSIRAVILTGAGHRAFSVGSDLRQRKDMTKEGLRPHSLHGAPAAQADLHRRKRDRLWRRLRTRPEH
jgi:enoyl-CoA hydratase